MIPLKSKASNLKKRMMQIEPASKAYFVKNETNIRLCHIEDKTPKYIVFPFCDYIAMITAAQLLKDCGIVDGYKAMQMDEDHFYVELIVYKYRRHTDAKGISLGVRVRSVVDWTALTLTPSDVKHFVARFELAKPVFDNTPKAPVIQMPIRQTISKRIA